MSKESLKAPFPYFGGKSRVADRVWELLGDPDNYIEPFAGTLAVLLRRPSPGRTETVNDANHFIANFWRAVKADPDAVAFYADHPVSECDLHARHRWLMRSEESRKFRAMMARDPEYFNARVAGWWVWGQCCWIGSAWCTDVEMKRSKSQPEMFAEPGIRKPTGDAADEMKRWGAYERGVNGNDGRRKIPYLERGDRGAVSFSAGDTSDREKIPFLNAGGKGVNQGESQQVPLLRGGCGMGVTSTGERLGRPQLADAYDIGRGVNSHREAGTCEDRAAFVRDWMRRLADRLRLVRVCYGDWNRICNSPTTMTRLGTVGAFLDPPYALDLDRLAAWKRHLIEGAPAPEGSAQAKNRAAGLYANDGSQDVDRLVADVNLWCRKWGADPQVRIVLAGYEGEHDDLLSLGWNVFEWKANGGYGNRSGGDNENAKRERLWTSPACVAKKTPRSLFEFAETESA